MYIVKMFLNENLGLRLVGIFRSDNENLGFETSPGLVTFSW